jgi:hypothetical protein
VQAVRDHQLNAGLRGGGQHAVALLGGHRHRLLAEDVRAGGGRALRVLAVQMVRERDVDCIDAFGAQALFEVRVVVGRHAVAAAEGPPLLGVAGDERSELGVPPGVSERRQHRDLRDVPRPDHRVTDAAALSGASHTR